MTWRWPLNFYTFKISFLSSWRPKSGLWKSSLSFMRSKPKNIQTNFSQKLKKNSIRELNWSWHWKCKDYFYICLSYIWNCGSSSFSNCSYELGSTKFFFPLSLNGSCELPNWEDINRETRKLKRRYARNLSRWSYCCKMVYKGQTLKIRHQYDWFL